VVGVATPPIVGVVARHKAADGGVTFGVRVGAGDAIVVGCMAVHTTATERRVGKGVFDAPAVFKPGPEGFAVSRLYIDQEALSHGEALWFREGCRAIVRGAGDAFS
jgi:hypothetical protein